MKKNIAMRWIKALRSGKYKQARSALRNKKVGYCCLGVLCEISKLGKFNRYDEYCGQRNVLPEKVMKWAEINDECGRIPNIGRLTALNDNNSSYNKITL